MHTPQQIYDCAILNWQSVLLKSKVDREMHMRGIENIGEEFFSWENSTQKSSVKDCKISTSIWIISELKDMESHCQKIKPGPLWDE
jgi:C1A family cysteine protease